MVERTQAGRLTLVQLPWVESLPLGGWTSDLWGVCLLSMEGNVVSELFLGNAVDSLLYNRHYGAGYTLPVMLHHGDARSC